MQNTTKNAIKYKSFIFSPHKIENFSIFFGGKNFFWLKIYINDILVVFINENAYKHHKTA